MARLDRINALIDEFWEDGVFEERERRRVYREGRRLLLSQRRIEALIEAGRIRAEGRVDDETRLHNALRNSIEFMLSMTGRPSEGLESASILHRWQTRKKDISSDKMARAFGLNSGQLRELDEHFKIWNAHPEGSSLKLMAGYRLGACICRLEATSRRNYKIIWSPTNPSPDTVRDLRRLIHDLEDMFRETLYELVGGKRRMSDWIEKHFPSVADRWIKNRGPHGILQELYFSDLFKILLHPAMKKDTERVFKTQGIFAFEGTASDSLKTIGADCNSLRNKAAHGKELNHFDLPRLHLYYDAIVDQLNAARNRGEIDVNTGSTRKYKRVASTESNPHPGQGRNRWKVAAVVAVMLVLMFEAWQHRHLVPPDMELGMLSSLAGNSPEPMANNDSLQATDSSSFPAHEIGSLSEETDEIVIETSPSEPSAPSRTNVKTKVQAVWDQIVTIGPDGTALWIAECTSTSASYCRWLCPDDKWREGSRLELTINVPGSYEVIMEVDESGYISQSILPFTVNDPVQTANEDHLRPFLPKKNARPPKPAVRIDTKPNNPCNDSVWGTSNNQKTILMDTSGWIPLYETPNSSAKHELVETGTEVEILDKKGKFRLVRTCNGQSGYVRKQQMRD